MRFIKKRSIVLFAAMALGLSVFAIGNAFAQTGSVMLYGSAGYHNVKEEFREVHLNPLGIGYQFNSNVIAGGNFVYSRLKNDEGGPVRQRTIMK